MKVLFFSHDGKLGDAVVNTAFVNGLLSHHPDCEIHATVAGVTDAFWTLDGRIAKRWPLALRSWRAIWRTGLAMRRERFDYIVTWRRMRSEKNKVLLWLARPGKVVDLRGFYEDGLQHQIETSRSAVRAITGRDVAELRYDLAPVAPCPELDRQLAAGGELIVLNLFAADAERNVPAAAAAAMLQGLRAQAPQAQLVLVCTNGSEAAARAVLAQAGVDGCAVNCDGHLGRLFDLCSRAHLLISPDTALIHLASAFDTPVIGIYQNNQIKPVQWGPRSCRSAIVLSDSPDDIACFSVDEVLDQARRLRAPESDAAQPISFKPVIA
ncbi:glycosyltransferase family 9 protein [Pseudoduganella violacea]|uniref:ADP-heptose:LPS heptosyltransferase n=1 Tax=Pseudoduganella violacea TaxID=1715466 RepID=A0A7W5FSZ0_9BURK|nr:glycosyltransferase family 9 protein [Pseudoduganella violacea]MBB3118041.1 ADP-heptose:LPS heptosyltransferase [Pseudoduganella violacea]